MASKPSPPAARVEPNRSTEAWDHLVYCPNCSARLQLLKCQARCPCCSFFQDCSDTIV